MGRVNFNLLLEAKSEYQKHLHNILTPHIYEGIIHIYSKSSEAGKNRLKYFQKTPFTCINDFFADNLS